MGVWVRGIHINPSRLAINRDCRGEYLGEYTDVTDGGQGVSDEKLRHELLFQLLDGTRGRASPENVFEKVHSNYACPSKGRNIYSYALGIRRCAFYQRYLYGLAFAYRTSHE